MCRAGCRRPLSKLEDRLSTRAAQNLLGIGKAAISADVLNVTNAAQSLQQNDLSGPSLRRRSRLSHRAPGRARRGTEGEDAPNVYPVRRDKYA